MKNIAQRFSSDLDIASRQSAPNVLADIKIAVVIPVFRHSVFLADAVTSALQQELDFEHRVIIVDDGCPHQETRRAAMAMALAYPSRIVYIRRRNGGLSAARNTGLEYALGRWSSVQAFYFLDADNTIERNTLSRAYAALTADPHIGWVYPDIAMFGSSYEYGDYSGPYSILRHLSHNTSEAGSMVRREVFDYGCRFDETMKLGFEDWEFWWQCIEAGFVGRHVPFFGLRYRKRPESMLSEVEREKEAVLSYMRRKHGKLFRAKYLLSLESQEAPRYALVLDEHRVKICTDVRQSGEVLEAEALITRLVASRQSPHYHSAPRFIVGCSEQALCVLQRLRLDRFTLWWLERQVSAGDVPHFVAVELHISPEFHGISLRQMDENYWPIKSGVHLLLARPSSLNAALDDERDDWIHTLLSDRPHPKVMVLRIELAGELAPTEPLPNIVGDWLRLFSRLRQKRLEMAPPFPKFKPRYLPPNSELGEVPFRLMQSGPLLPLPDDGCRDICFALPLLAFGGVEKVALHMAAQFRRRGWRCHLLILAQTAALSDDWLTNFDSVSFYYEEVLYQWSDALQFLGTNYPSWVTAGEPRWVEGLLLPMDAIINFHCAALHRIAAKLRRSGVATAVSLHVNDRTTFGRETGHPFLALGYEHVYDIFAVCSKALMDWCHAMGVPEDKLVLVPNAPAHDPMPEDVVAILRNRAKRAGTPPEMNVLFIGRLDRQKGLDRLAAIIERCSGLGLPIHWRVVGSAVTEPAANSAMQHVRGLLEPAVNNPQDLTALYRWADVLLLPSHWEGLPLTILEASRLGVVPVAARVGAMEEAVVHGETGLLIDDLPLDAFVNLAVDGLTQLLMQPGLLYRLSRQAAVGMTRSWDIACDEIIEHIERAVNAKKAQQQGNRGKEQITND